jgi:uncharacterized protein (DUF983 family)
MSTSKNNSTSSGVGFPGLLTILFIGLKLTGYINWPWVWVLSPLWISLSLFMVAVLIIGLIYLFLGITKKP